MNYFTSMSTMRMTMFRDKVRNGSFVCRNANGSRASKKIIIHLQGIWRVRKRLLDWPLSPIGPACNTTLRTTSVVASAAKVIPGPPATTGGQNGHYPRILSMESCLYHHRWTNHQVLSGEFINFSNSRQVCIKILMQSRKAS